MTSFSENTKFVHRSAAHHFLLVRQMHWCNDCTVQKKKKKVKLILGACGSTKWQLSWRRDASFGASWRRWWSHECWFFTAWSNLTTWAADGTSRWANAAIWRQRLRSFDGCVTDWASRTVAAWNNFDFHHLIEFLWLWTVHFLTSRWKDFGFYRYL